jgi:ornithine cyclodeaminase/alanine dehydrogenase-like protein (mu-crystallin family)
MRVVDAAALDRALSFPGLIEALREAFRGRLDAPPRHHHEVPAPDGGIATLLLMPAYVSAGGADRFMGVKIVTVYPGNGRRGLPSVYGTYLLMDGSTGAPVAALDGTRLTLWRTAAASALAARFLARPGAERLLMVGAGALAPFLIRSHRSEQPIREVRIWARRPERAERLASELAAEGLPVTPAGELEAEAREADIVSCATLSQTPLIRGAWLKDGAHLDLVGAFNLQMREADDEALTRAAVHIDTPAALTEGGDVAVALATGRLDRSAVRGDLAALCRGEAPGRTRPDEITLFKSIGASIEDLAAAMLAWQGLAQEGGTAH